MDTYVMSACMAIDRTRHDEVDDVSRDDEPCVNKHPPQLSWYWLVLGMQCKGSDVKQVKTFSARNEDITTSRRDVKSRGWLPMIETPAYTSQV